MNNGKRNISVIKRIADYCNEITGCVKRFGDSAEAFKTDSAYRNACSMCILQIGELSAHLTDDFKQSYNEIPWKKIKSMRNVFAHEYEDMSCELTWATIQQDIPSLMRFCETVLRHYNILEQPAVEVEYNEDEKLENQYEDELEP
jgi:uncharacterized protein with HEPN domain